MSIICTRCGGTQVVCEATVNPNTKVITEISDDSLQFGRCETCKARSVLTDVEKTKAAIKSGFAGFVEANGRKPHYASCRIVWKYTNDSEDVKIRLLESGESIGNDMFFSCNSLHALESLAEFGKEPFIVTECYGFKTLTEEEISDEKAYEYEFGDEKIVVTGKEVRAFYSEVYRLTAQDIEQFAAYNTAKRMYYRKNDCQLTPELVRRLLDEEHLMKAGESDSFTIQLLFLWHVRIRKEPENFAPFKYALEACCLDNVQTFSRRYITLEKALLHCLNGFNENANIQNRYQSLQDYLLGQAHGKR